MEKKKGIHGVSVEAMHELLKLKLGFFLEGLEEAGRNATPLLKNDFSCIKPTVESHVIEQASMIARNVNFIQEEIQAIELEMVSIPIIERPIQVIKRIERKPPKSKQYSDLNVPHVSSQKSSPMTQAPHFKAHDSKGHRTYTEPSKSAAASNSASADVNFQTTERKNVPYKTWRDTSAGKDGDQ